METNSKVDLGAKGVEIGKEDLDRLTRSKVHEWIKKDLDAALAFLQMLRKYPDVMERFADQLYDQMIDERKLDE